MKQYNTLIEFCTTNKVTESSKVFLTSKYSIPSIKVVSTQFPNGSALVCASNALQKSGALKEGQSFQEISHRKVWTVTKDGEERHKFVGDPIPTEDITEFLK